MNEALAKFKVESLSSQAETVLTPDRGVRNGTGEECLAPLSSGS